MTTDTATAEADIATATSARSLATTIAAALCGVLPGGTRPEATSSGRATDVVEDAAALRITLTGPARATVVVAAWGTLGEGLSAGAQSPVASLAEHLESVLTTAAISVAEDADELPLGAALDELGDAAASTILHDGVGPVGVVAVATPAAATIPQPSAPSPLEQFDDPAPSSTRSPRGGDVGRLELLSGVELVVTAELGRTRMSLRDLLTLTPGSIVELDRAAGSPVDLRVNGTLVARGEVVVVDEEFGLRITELVNPDAGTVPGL